MSYKYSVAIKRTIRVVLASYPGHFQLHVVPVFQRAKLKSWEWPGDEASYSVVPQTPPL